MDSPSSALTPGLHPKEEDYEKMLRPRTLDEFIGQQKIKDNLRVFVTAALQRGETLDHVLLSGPAGLGKCITADSLILTGRGWVPFRDLIPPGMTPDSSRPLEVSVYGVGGLETTSHVYASGTVPTRRITTRSGFVLEGTPHHPVLVATPEGPAWKRLDHLSVADYVAIGCGLDVWGEARQATWKPDAPAHRRRSEVRVPSLHAALTEGPAAVERRTAYAGHLETVERAAAVAALPDVAEAYTLALDADLAYLLGVLVAGGHVEQGSGFPAIVVTCDEPEMQVELRRISRRHFGRAPRAGTYGGSAARLRFGQDLGRACLALGLEAAAAGERSVPSAVLTSPREVVVGFLQGLFDAGGRVRRAGYVALGTRSERLSREVQLLLANLGIMARRTEKQGAGAACWQLVVGGPEAVRFRERVGFRLSRKRARAAGWQRWSRGGSRSGNQVPAALADPRIYWDRVAEVRASEAEAFDFVVPGTHSFVANGFFNHNTTLAFIVAEEMGAGITTSSGPVLDKPASMAGILTNLNEGDVLFIDEIHRLSPVVEEYLYSAMEDYRIDIVIDAGPNARSVKLTLPPFTLVGATTRKGLLTAPLRARFGIDFRYDYYTADLLQRIVLRSAGILRVEIDDAGAFEIARRSRGTPRIANRLLRRTRDFAEVEADGRITRALADHALNALDVDQEGLDDMDARILLTLIEKFGGGPTGLANLSVSVGEDAGTIEEVYEPYLIQEGYLERTARGRVATPRAYAHFGLAPPAHTGNLFGT